MMCPPKPGHGQVPTPQADHFISDAALTRTRRGAMKGGLLYIHTITESSLGLGFASVLAAEKVNNPRSRRQYVGCGRQRAPGTLILG